MRSLFARTAGVALGGLLVLLISAAAAGASQGSHADADDSPGLFDIETIRHESWRGQRGVRIAHEVRTFDPWTSDRLKEPPNGFSFELELDGDLSRERPFEQRVVIDADRSGLRARMLDRGGHFIARLHAWKPNARTVRVVFPRKLLGHGVDVYRWYADSLFVAPDFEDCRGREGQHYYDCFDIAPARPYEGDLLTHRLQ